MAKLIEHLPRLALLIVTLTICVIAPASLSAQSQQRDQQLAKAQECFLRGDFEQARQQYKLAAEANPRSAQARIGLAQTLLKLDDWKSALAEADKAIAFGGNLGEALATLGSAQLRSGDPNAAGISFLRALSQDIENHRALVGLAQLRITRSQYDQALDHLRDAIRVAPDRPEGYYWLGELLRLQRRYPEAADAFEKFLSLNPKGHPENLRVEDLQGHIQLLRSFGQTTPFALTGSAQTSIKMEFLMGLPVIKATVNGSQQATFILDTGARDAVVIGEGLAANLAAQKISRTVIYGIGGKQQAWTARVDRLSLGDLTVHNIPAYVIDLELISRALGQTVDGVMGLSWLSYSQVTFDFVAREVLIGPASLEESLRELMQPEVAGRAPNFSISLPFRLFNRQIIFPATVKGEPVSLLLDTGAQHSLLSASFVSEHYKEDEIIQRQLNSGGVGGMLPPQVAVVKDFQFQIADKIFPIASVPAVGALDGNIGKRLDLRVAGIIGNLFLQNLSKLRIDYANQVLTWEFVGK